MKIRLLSSAKQDLRDGFNFYEEKESGLGAYFLESLYSDVDSLRIFAGVHEIHFKKYYRALSKRFPYAIYYTESDNVIEAHAIIDCRRNPVWIKSKLE
jgi:plasmid stabilization system protein ParE